MVISLELIKELREKSGAGMADCKNALTEADGNLEQAMDLLRKKGIAKAAKRSDRETGEGLVKVATNEDNNEGYMFKICAETDFVVRSEQFQDFAIKLLEVVKGARVDTREALLDIDLENDGTVGQAMESLSSLVGEKIELKQYATITSGGTVGAYSHAGEQIGSLVAINLPNMPELARDLAMQVAAANPKYSIPDEVTVEELQREKSIYAEQLQKEGKPEAMIEKIMSGKINKYYEEVCLTEQEFIKDESKKIKQLLGEAKVERFVRFAL